MSDLSSLSDDELLAMLAQSMRGTAATPRRQGSMAANILDSFTQGATLGFGDEISAFEAAALGRRPEGGWFDYSKPFGERYERALEFERGQNRAFRQTNPVASTAAEVGGALAGAVATPIGAVGAPVRGASLAYNAGRAGGGGAALGGVYGFGSGEGGTEERLSNMPLSAGFGFLAGAAAVPLMQGASNAVRHVVDKVGAGRVGMSPEAANILRAVIADDTAAGGGASRIAESGPGAMLADAGPGALNMLDVVGQFPAGRQVVTPAVQSRAAAAAKTVNAALDDVFGAPQGPRAVARETAESTAEGRASAYDAAYATPINYAGEAGRRIESVLARIPKSTLSRAVQEANEEMQSQGLRNQQILADIADDGTVTFREMPNVQQLDEIKKALQRIGYSEVDQFGRPTGVGARARRLAHDLRVAIGDAAPAYNKATQEGADKIAMDQALELGREFLRPQITREEIAERLAGMTKAERQMVGTGIRSQIDDMMANVKRAVSDGNVDAREAAAAVRELSSRANQEKLTALLGGARAKHLLSRIDVAARALEVRAGVAQNSRTAPRQLFNETLGAQQDTLSNAVLSGNIPNIWQRSVQTMTGRRPADMARRKEELAAEIADALTGKRGPDAQRLAERLLAQNSAAPGVTKPADDISQLLLLGARPAAVGLLD